MIKRGLALSLVLGLASVVQADAVIDCVPDPGPPYSGGELVTVSLFLRQLDDPEVIEEDIWVRLIELHFDASDAHFLLEGNIANFQWTFGSVGHYKDQSLSAGPEGVTVAYYYEVSDELGPNPGEQLMLPGDHSERQIATLEVTLPVADRDCLLDVLNRDAEDENGDPDPDMNALVAFGFGLGDDPVTSWRASDRDLTAGPCWFIFPPPVTCEVAAPVHESSLWRTTNNIVRLTCNRDITVPGLGEVLIQEMIEGGTYGPDLVRLACEFSGDLCVDDSDCDTGADPPEECIDAFTFEVENDGGGNPRILKITEDAAVLTHRTRYAFHNTGGWAAVQDFAFHYVVQMGDANEDLRVQFNDLAFINTFIGLNPAPDDHRADINGDGRVQFNDLAAANEHIRPPPGVVDPPGGF